MRFLLTSHVAPPHIGGVENLVLAEAKALVAAGHSVTWITSDRGGDGQPIPASIDVVRVRAWHGPERWFRIAYPLFSPSLLWRLWRAVGAADVVHAHGLVFVPSPIACVFARLRGKWSSCTDHGGLLRYRLGVGSLLLRLLFATAGRVTARAANRLIAYNRDVEALLQRLSGSDTKVQFVANPVDPTLFRPPTSAERAAARAVLGWDDTPRILCIGRLLPHKGVDVLLAAADPEWRIVFCGPGDDATVARIRAAGAECLAPRPQAELRLLYHAADVFALPSYNEGFPVVVQEALACGLPVVTSDADAYAPYRALVGLHLCRPEPHVVRERLRDALRTPRTARAAFTDEKVHAAWLQSTMPPLVLPPRAAAVPGWVVAVVALAIVHVALGIGRLPKTWSRRSEDIAAYRRDGAAAFLFDSARLRGADVLARVRRDAPDDAAVLWRWPSDGGLELAAALLAPRLVVDERSVPHLATEAVGRTLARGVGPDGRSGVLVLQGTDDRGITLRVREP